MTKQNEHPRPGPRARWGLITVVFAGIAAALLLLARQDRRWELQKTRLKAIESTIQVSQQKINTMQSILAEHDERAKEWIEEHEDAEAK